jgi:hypothetical protein
VGFTKLDESILLSSIMAEDPETFKVWIALLAACKEDGIARVAVSGIAAITFLPIDTVRVAIDKLSSPDVDSRSLNDEGRRIRRVDGGYQIINYQKYRELSSKEKEAQRKWQKRNCPEMSGNVRTSADSSASASSSEIFNYWISNNNLIKHTSITKMMIEYINLRLQEYSLEALKKCIDNYNLILSDSKKYWYSYKHSLDEFFRNGDRKPAPYLKFLPERFVESNFLRNQNGFEKNDPEDDGIVWQ